MLKDFTSAAKFDFGERPASLDEMADALLFLSRIGAMKLEGGFLVIYNGMCLKRRVLDNKRLYRKDDYHTLDAYYQLKIQQIHIVGEFANMMVRDHAAALKFVNDYFRMEYTSFVAKFFSGEKAKSIRSSITAAKRRSSLECCPTHKSGLSRTVFRESSLSQRGQAAAKRWCSCTSSPHSFFWRT